MSNHSDSRLELKWRDELEVLMCDDANEAFALDQRLAERAASGEGPFLHVWRADKVLVLGSRDVHRGIESVSRYFQQLGIHLIERNSGGALVPLDAGVLNVSYICAKQPGQFQVDDDFHFLASWLSEAMGPSEVSIGEVAGSYCPGRFDIQIGGQKVCGIAQRRYSNAVVVHAFVNVLDDGGLRALLAQAFYHQIAHSQTHVFPIQLDKVGSLQMLTDVKTIDEFCRRLRVAGNTRFSSIVDDLQE